MAAENKTAWVGAIVLAAVLCSAAATGQLSVPNMDVAPPPPENWEAIAPLVRDHLENCKSGVLDADVADWFTGSELVPPRNFTFHGLQVQSLQLNTRGQLSVTLAAPMDVVKQFVGDAKYVLFAGTSAAETRVFCANEVKAHLENSKKMKCS